MPEFRPPSFINARPYDEIATPQGIDALFDAYQRSKMQGRQEMTQNAQLAGQGIDPMALKNDPASVYGPLMEQFRAKRQREGQMADVDMRLKESEIVENLREPRQPGGAGYLPAEEANRLLNMNLFTPGSMVSPAQLSLAKPRFALENRPATTAESVAAGFADKAEQADKVLATLTGSGFNPSGLGAAMNTALPNFMKSGNFQASDQALRQFVNAVLRRESGAAIPPSELENYRKQYWPQVGDAPAVLAQKADARRVAVSGLREEGKRVPSQLPGSPGAAGTGKGDPLGLFR